MSADCSIFTCILSDGANADRPTTLDQFVWLGVLIKFSLLFLTWRSCLCVAGYFATIKRQRQRCPWSRELHALAWPVGVPTELTSPPQTPLLMSNLPLPVQALPFLCGIVIKTSLPTWLCTAPVLQHYIIYTSNRCDKVHSNKTWCGEAKPWLLQIFDILQFIFPPFKTWRWGGIQLHKTVGQVWRWLM